MYEKVAVTANKFRDEESLKWAVFHRGSPIKTNVPLLCHIKRNEDHKTFVQMKACPPNKRHARIGSDKNTTIGVLDFKSILRIYYFLQLKSAVNLTTNVSHWTMSLAVDLGIAPIIS